MKTLLNVVSLVLSFVIGFFGGIFWSQLLHTSTILSWNFDASMSVKIISSEQESNLPSPARAIVVHTGPLNYSCDLMECMESGYETPVYIFLFCDNSVKKLIIINKWSSICFDEAEKTFTPMPSGISQSLLQSMPHLVGVLVFPPKNTKPVWMPEKEITSGFLKAQGLVNFLNIKELKDR